MVAGGEEGGGEDSNRSRSSWTVCSEPVDIMLCIFALVLCGWGTVVSLTDTVIAVFADISVVCEEVGTLTLTWASRSPSWEIVGNLLGTSSVILSSSFPETRLSCTSC